MSARRPTVTLKLATSLDGRIATRTGDSQWITGPEARARVHRMRAAHDAILVGIGTALADDPRLTARTDPSPGKQPLRIVADAQARLPATSQLVRTLGQGPVAVATAVGGAPALEAAGVELWQCRAGASGGVDLGDLLDRAGDEGARTLFVEGGGGLAASFLAQDLVDRLEWFRAPIVIGGDGLAAVASVDVSALGDTKRYRLAAAERIGDDGLETYVRIEEN